MTIEEIQRAVASLSPDELSRFRAWFAEHEAAAWDEQMRQDAAAGRLDELVDEARRDFREGRSRPL